ncbi:glycoside hydrolase superfamily [Mucidula mucida]|nr:glycoside hydrolase superfamily [Mucidula mucida]
MVQARLLVVVLLLPLGLALDPLHDYLNLSGRYLGFFTNKARQDSAGATYNSIAKTNFDAATESNACKWEVIEPSQGQFSWSACDYTFNWITGLGGKFRGHTLVWHSQLAGWVNNLRGTAVDAAMKNHIGSNFIEKAFTYARAADPNAKLYYNDYNIEAQGTKQNGAYNLVQGLAAKGLIDGVGLQGHFTVGQMPANLAATVTRFASLGVDVAFTEVDIGTRSQDFTGQARDYTTVVNACIQEPRCVGITVGGVRDNESPSWRNGEYCLLWNEQYQPKPAATAVATAAEAASPVSTTAAGSTSVTAISKLLATRPRLQLRLLLAAQRKLITDNVEMSLCLVFRLHSILTNDSTPCTSRMDRTYCLYGSVYF